MTTQTTTRQSPALKAKIESVKALKSNFDKATSVVFVGFKGLTVPQVTELRSRFRKAGVDYSVVKNNLIRQALKGGPLEKSDTLDKQLVGETGVAFSFEDPSVAAKILKAFRKEGDGKNEKLELKAGILEDALLSGKEVENNLATLPGKDELRAMLLATLQAPAQNLVVQLAAPLQNFAYLLDARKRQLEAQGA